MRKEKISLEQAFDAGKVELAVESHHGIYIPQELTIEDFMGLSLMINKFIKVNNVDIIGHQQKVEEKHYKKRLNSEQLEQIRLKLKIVKLLEWKFVMINMF